jgi:hypothetical protein
MKGLRWSLGACAAAAMCLGTWQSAHAEDTASLRQQIADLENKVVSLESSQAPGYITSGGDIESLTSMKKNAAVRIGGDIHVDLIYVERDDDPLGINGGDDKIETTIFNGGTAAGDGSFLNFQVNATPDTYLFISLEITDLEDGAANTDDLLEELYFAWERINGTSWDVKFGKKAVDYGMNMYTGITPSFHDGTAFWLDNSFDAAGGTGSRATGNPHLPVGTNMFPTGPTQKYQIEAIYRMKDMLNIYFTLFQNQRGHDDDGPDDSMFFESWALKAEYMMGECLMIQGSLLKQQFDSMDDSSNRGLADRENDQWALSLGIHYRVPNMPLELWAEYQHGFDWVYDDDSSADVLGVGATYGVTDCFDVTAMVEYANIDDGQGHVGGSRFLGRDNFSDEDYWQIAINGKYTFHNGMYLMGEYAHQWYDADGGGNDSSGDADMLGFRAGIVF